MKKKLQQWAALCLTLALAFCLALPVWAENLENATSTLTITGLESGVTVNAYKIMSVNWYNDDNANYQAPEDPEFTWNNQIQTWVQTYYPTYIGTSNEVTETFATDSAVNQQTFFNAMAVEINKFSIAPIEGSVSGTDGAVQLEMGGYLILITGGTKIYNPIFVGVEAKYSNNSWSIPNKSIPAKAESLQITKTVKKTEAGVGGEKTTAGIAESVYFTLETDVPSYPDNAKYKTYAISDILPTGMTLTNGSIAVYATPRGENQSESALTNTENSIWTMSSQRPGSLGTSSFTLDFNYEQIKNYKKIRVTYSATLNKDTTVGPAGNINHAYLDYSKEPLGASDILLSADDTTTVYSYGIKVNKVDEESNALSDAEFTLSRKSDGTDPITFVGSDGTYRVATATDASTDETLVVAASGTDMGKLTLSGLDVGTYYLTETKAPGGYVKLANPVVITITDAAPNGLVDDGTSGADGADGYYELNVENSQGFTLPSTGGMGTVLFTTIGIVLMGGGLVLLLFYLRRRNRAE